MHNKSKKNLCGAFIQATIQGNITCANEKPCSVHEKKENHGECKYWQPTLNAYKDWKERFLKKFPVFIAYKVKQQAQDYSGAMIDVAGELEHCEKEFQDFISTELLAAEQRGAQRERERIAEMIEGMIFTHNPKEQDDNDKQLCDLLEKIKE